MDKKFKNVVKRIICLSMVAVLTVLCAACGTKGDGEEDGLTKITWYMNSDPLDDLPLVLEKINEITNEKLGVELDIKLIDDGAYTERLKMYMAAGNEFDLCFTGYVNPYMQAVSNGGLVALDELIKNEAPGILDSIPDYALDAARIDGKIYALPNMQAMATAPAYFVRKDIAEKYGLDKIDYVESLDELEPYFDKMLEDYPDRYPVTSAPADDIFQNYQDINEYATLNKNENNHKIYLKQELPEYTKFLERAKRWQAKGYVRPDVEMVSNTSAEIKAGKYCGTFTSNTPGSLENYKQEFGIEAHAIQYAPTYMKTHQMTAAMTAVSATSKNPEKAIKVLELVNSDPELFNLIQYGIKGTHYDMKDDHVEFLARDRYYIYGWKFGNTFNSLLLEGETAEKVDNIKKMNDAAEKPIFLGFNIDSNPIKNETAQCDAVRKEYEKTLAAGVTDYTKILPTYMSRLKDAGINNMISKIQQQLDAWWTANK